MNRPSSPRLRYHAPMRVRFGLHRDGLEPTPPRTAVGEITVGPLGFLGLLESDLGIPAGRGAPLGGNRRLPGVPSRLRRLGTFLPPVLRRRPGGRRAYPERMAPAVVPARLGRTISRRHRRSAWRYGSGGSHSPHRVFRRGSANACVPYLPCLEDDARKFARSNSSTPRMICRPPGVAYSSTSTARQSPRVRDGQYGIRISASCRPGSPAISYSRSPETGHWS